MMKPRIEISLVACCAAFAGGTALGQESSREEADGRASVQVPEEVIVRGRKSGAALRAEIRLAEEAVYGRFNAINSNDEFDIVCRSEELTGSRIPRRVCQPNFWRQAQASAARETVRGLQGGPAFSAQHFQGEALHKQRLLGRELRRLAREDEELMQALARLMTLDQAMSDRRSSGASGDATEPREAADEQSLPYAAVRVTDGRVGHQQWSHRLSRRTFTVAHVYGEVRTLRIQCGDRNARIEYETGVEWTLPEGWENCRVLVDAPPGTTLSLYEFEP